MNDKKFCFIMCTNQKKYEEECIRFIRSLLVPDGYEVEILTILEAKSMTSGYNEGMRASDAKYKIYLHQDVFIIHKRMLFDILEIFKEKEIGMIGMIGVPRMPKCGVQWNERRCGKIYGCNILRTAESDFDEVDGAYKIVEAIDGMMMITQYDITWREDLFKGFDFYDSSQSQEFIRAGYKVIVPAMKHPWCLHDDGVMNLQNYYHDREIYVKEYKDK